MLERINQLNILRESNMTLRADCETYSKRSRELDAKLKVLSTELDPAKEQARVAHAELQARDAQIVLLESESKRWQERNAQLLNKVGGPCQLVVLFIKSVHSTIVSTPLTSKP